MNTMIIEIIYLVLAVFALIQILVALKQNWGTSLGSVFTSFFIAIVLLSGIRLFFFFTDFHFINIDEVTTMTIWHLMFYETIGMIIIVNKNLLSLVDTTVKAINMSYLNILALIFMITLFFIAKPADHWIVSHIEGTFWDMFGMFHFVAFVFAGVVASSLFVIRRKFASSIGAIANPLLVSVATLSIIHLWELLNESWKVIHVTDEVGEGVERILWIPVYFFVAYAFWIARKSSTQAKV